MLKRDGAADEVSLDGAMRHLVDGISQSVRDIIVGVDIADGFLQECLVDGWEIGIVIRSPYLRQTCYAGAIVWSGFLYLLQVASAQALDDDGLVAEPSGMLITFTSLAKTPVSYRSASFWMVFILVLWQKTLKMVSGLLANISASFLLAGRPTTIGMRTVGKATSLSGAEHRIDSCRIFCKQ